MTKNNIPGDLLDLFGLAEPVHNPPQMVSERELATFWGVSDRQVRILLSEGVIIKTNGKFYDLAEATRAYIRHLIQSAKLRGGADPELKAEKLRLAREQADKLEIQNAASRGELVPAAAVQSSWESILTDLRAALLAIPARLAVSDRDAVDSEIRAALERLADDA